MAKQSSEHPLPPCPDTPNCIRTSIILNASQESVLGSLSEIFKQDAHKFKVTDTKRIELHAVYRIPVFGFNDDVNVILEGTDGKTTVYIRSASRIGGFDFGVNKRRVKRIHRKLKSRC